MNNFIRELYNSEICEVNRCHNLSMKGKAAANKQENIYNKLSSSLEKNDLNLLEEYIDAGFIIRSEELFHAYVSGMKDFIRFITSVLDEE